jgi:riboflavin transporter FmnP
MQQYTLSLSSTRTFQYFVSGTPVQFIASAEDVFACEGLAYRKKGSREWTYIVRMMEISVKKTKVRSIFFFIFFVIIYYYCYYFYYFSLELLFLVQSNGEGVLRGSPETYRIWFPHGAPWIVVTLILGRTNQTCVVVVSSASVFKISPQHVQVVGMPANISAAVSFVHVFLS